MDGGSYPKKHPSPVRSLEPHMKENDNEERDYFRGITAYVAISQ